MTDAKQMNPFLQLLDSLNRSRGETTSSFFLKKISNMENHKTNFQGVYTVVPLFFGKYR
jgi:hypothetical protein